MNILHVTQNYFPSIGGTQHTMQKVSECLQDIYNDTVAVYTTNSYYGPNNRRFKKIEEQHATINGVDVQRFPFFRAHKPLLGFISKASLKIGGRSLPASLNEIAAGPVSASMRQALIHSRADVICASSVHYMFASYGIYRQHISNPRPFVLYGALHLAAGYVPDNFMARIRAADHYIANTVYEKEFLTAQHVHPAKITVAGAGTDILEQATVIYKPGQAKKELGIPAGKQMILCISRQEAFKGLPVLLEAYKQVKQSNDACLVIAGASGTYHEQLRQEQQQTAGLYVFTDINEEIKCRLLQLADIVVLPSKEESFGVVFLEAWSFKKPVIGARIGAVAALVNEGEDGCLFAPDNAGELACCINELLAMPALQRQWGENGYTKVQRFFTWNKITAAFRTAYMQAIEDFKG